MTLSFTTPLVLALLLLLVPLARWWNRTALSLTAGRKRASLVLRLLTLICLIFALAGAQVVRLTRDLSVIYLLDRSLSTGADSLTWQRDFLEQSLKARGDNDAFGILLFGQDARVELGVGQHEVTTLGKFSSVVNRESSNLTSALRFAATAFPEGTAGRLVVLSDGQSTEPEVADEAASLAAAGIEVWTVPTPEKLQARDLLLSRLEAPSNLAKDEPFLLRAVVESHGVGEAELLLSANGRPSERLRLKLQEGSNLFMIPQRVSRSGPVHYEARLLSADDSRPENNKGETLVMVGQEQVVMVLRSEPGPGALVGWLEQAGLKARAVTPGELPRRVGAWRDVSALIIEDVSALDWSLELQKVVSLLVRDGGMGLMMLGSDSTFGVGGYSYTPIEPLLPVELSIRRPKDMPLAALVQCLDKSGSMSGRPIEMAREAAIAAGETLSEKDMLGVVSFDDAARWVYPLSVKGSGNAFSQKIASLRAGGGTDMYPALEQAVSELENATAALKHVIVLSDGATAPAAFEALMARAEKSRITVSAVALGSGADLEFLKRLTKMGKGRLYVAPDSGPGTPLPQIFIREAILATGSGLSQKPAEVRPTAEGANSPIFQGLAMGKTPRLATYNLASSKGGTTSTLLATPKGDPILATGRAGLGKTAAWTSDLGAVWAASWAATPGVGGSSLLETLMLRSIRSINAAGDLNDRSRGGSLRVSSIAGGTSSSVTLELSSREPLHGPVKAVVVDGRGNQTTAILHPTSPYQASGSVTLSQAGSALVFAHDGKGELLARSVLSLPLAPEFARLGNDTEALKAMAARSGGQYDASAESVYLPPARPFPKRTPLGDDLMRGALLLLMLEIAVRRLPRPKLPASKARPVLEPSTEVHETMSNLRQAKQSVRESAKPISLPVRPKVERISSAPATKPTKPTKPPETAPHSAPQTTPQASTEGSTLERLRQAKKRGRQSE